MPDLKEQLKKYIEKIDKENAREIIYGMPHKIWKDKFQKDATPEQMNKFDEKHK